MDPATLFDMLELLANHCIHLLLIIMLNLIFLLFIYYHFSNILISISVCSFYFGVLVLKKNECGKLYILIFGVESWFFTRNTPTIFTPPSARRNFFKCAPNCRNRTDGRTNGRTDGRTDRRTSSVWATGVKTSLHSCTC
jgi:hypothetical protein